VSWRTVPAAVVLSLCSLTAYPEDYTVEQILFLPPTFYVGDTVELRVRISVSEGFVPSEPSELPEPTWIHVRDVRIIPIADDYDIRVAFSTYRPGTGELPSIEMGDIVLSGLEIITDSIIGDEVSKIDEAFGPLPLPGTRLLLALTVGVLVVLPVLLIGGYVTIRRLIAALIDYRRGRRPWRKLDRLLEELKQIRSPVNNREFYLALSDGLRAYLSVRVGDHVSALTSQELQRILRQGYPELPELNKIAAELPRFDMVKFGGKKASPAKRNQDLASVREAASGLERRIAAARSRKKGKQNVDA
jgi:hypothetical protein